MSIRNDALEALSAAIKAADPEVFIRENVSVHNSNLVVGRTKLDLSRFERVLVIGGGKAGPGMASAIEKLLGERITGGLVNIPDYLQLKHRQGRIRFNPATHPIPSKSGISGVKKMLELVGRPNARDLIVCLLSGGASALMPFPVTGLGLRDKQMVTRKLLGSGASIREVNTVRRHLSRVKGGRLAESLYPASVVSLIISDVVGDRPDDVGSGPTAPDPSTYGEAVRILRKYRLWDIVPESVRTILSRGAHGALHETPKPGSMVFQRVHNIVVGTNKKSCETAATILRRKGYRAIILTRRLQGEARHAGRFFASILSGPDGASFSLKPPSAIVAGGETTVSVRGSGLGGRNQELVLAAALDIRGSSGVVVASAATDGLDGPTDAAGAVADGATVDRALIRGMDPDRLLQNNDSFRLFKKLNDLVITGPTGTNVGDITLALAGPRGIARPTGRLGTA